MRCPRCQGSAKVVDSRSDAEGVTRLRICKDCSYRFYTAEVPVEYTNGQDRISNYWRKKYGDKTK